MAQSASPASTDSADESAETLALTKQLMNLLKNPAMARLLAASSSSGSDGATPIPQRQQPTPRQKLQEAATTPAHANPPSRASHPARTKGAVATIFLHGAPPDPASVKANYAALHTASTSTAQSVLHDFADDPAIHAFMVCVQGGHGVDPHLQLLLAPRRVHVTAVEGGNK